MSKKLILAGWLAVAAGNSMAQTEEASRDTTSLPELTISITKLEKPQKESAKPVQVITNEVIERNQGKDLSQLLQEQTGMIVGSAYSNPGKNKNIYMRGANGKYTLILIDGMAISDPSGSGGAIDLRLISLAQVERIEILKGSQSNLYGADAIAGVINIITKKGADAKVSASGSASAGSLSTSNSTFNLGGNVDKVRYNVGVQRYVSEGISDALDETDTLDFDKDGLAQTVVNANVNWQINENLSFNPVVIYSDYEGGYDDDAFVDAAHTFRVKLFNASGRLKYSKEKLDVVGSYAYSATDRTFITSSESEFNGRLGNGELFATYKASKNIHILGGVNFQSHQMLFESDDVTDPSVSIVSPFVTGVLKPIDGLNVELGYRYNNHSNFGGNGNYSAAANYWVNDQVKVFGSYTTGFKTPTLNEMYGNFGPNPDLKPETSASYEGGLQVYLMDEKLTGIVTYYDRSVDNIIVYDFLTGYNNRDVQNDYGVELNFNYKASDKLNLMLGYDFVDGAITQQPDGASETTFNNLIRRPKHSGIAGIGYRPMKQLFINLTAQYIGNRIDYFFNPDNFFAREDVDLDAYVLVNLYAEYAVNKGNVVFFADLKNIANADIVEVYGFNGLGFNSQAGLRFNIK